MPKKASKSKKGKAARHKAAKKEVGKGGIEEEMGKLKSVSLALIPKRRGRPLRAEWLWL